MTMLKGRPTRETSTEVSRDASKEGKRVLSDGDMVKVSTMLPAGMHRRMKIAAAQQDLKIEEAYREAVEAYLNRH
jgi:hypothetical protein